MPENRNELIVDARTTLASGTAEREAALEMLESLPGRYRATVGADKGYDAREFVAPIKRSDRFVRQNSAEENESIGNSR